MRICAGAASVALLAAALSACTATPVDAGAEWLAGRDGIAAAETVAAGGGVWADVALIRGELVPGIGDDRLIELIAEAREYRAAHPGIAIWIGAEHIDLSVGDSADAVADAAQVAAWRTVTAAGFAVGTADGADGSSTEPGSGSEPGPGVSDRGVRSGIVLPGEVRVRTLREDAPAALDAISGLDGGIRLEAFADERALDADRIADYTRDVLNPLAVEYLRAPGCVPRDAVRGFVDSLLTRDGVSGATADLCSGVTIDLPAGAPLAEQAGALRAELDARGLSDLPVQVTSDDGAGIVRFAAIAPGEPALLEVLAVFESADAPAVSYSLGTGGELAVTGYGIPTSELLALVQPSPVSGRLSGIGLEGDPVAVVGPPDRLPGLLDEALALVTAGSSRGGVLGNVQLGPGFAAVALETAPGATGPDVAAAIEVLRDSGVTVGRHVTVRFAEEEAEIVDGIAALHEPGTGSRVLQTFVDAWNA